MNLRERAIGLGALLLSGLFSLPSYAQDNTQPSIAPRLSGDLRLRFENLERDDFNQDGNALTLRFLGTFEVDIFEKTSFLAEIEGVKALIDDYNDGTGDNPRLPFIPDPEGLELNRLQINGQTVEAIRLETTALGRGILDVGYFNKVRRPLGGDNIGGVFTGDSFFANYNLATPIGRVSAFHYAADLETASDQFLRTPDDGVRDYSILAQYDFGAVGPFSNVTSFARHHWFEADTDGRHYGRELNLSLRAKFNKTGLALEYASYKAETFSSDTDAVFLTTEISF